MLACLDVHYREALAVGARVLARAWEDATPAETGRVVLPVSADYRPGEFYRRELPVLLALLEGIARPETVVIDGYVWLGAKGEPGLGAHLFEALGRAVPVVGVAKTPYRGATFAMPVLRGSAKRPLYVTAAGIEPELAAAHVRAMHGPYRVPTLLREADRLSRQTHEAPGR